MNDNNPKIEERTDASFGLNIKPALNSDFERNTGQKITLNSPSVRLLLFSNIVTVFFAIKDSWSLSSIMWVYWFQSITIGLFNIIRILQLKEYSTEGFMINGRTVSPGSNTTRLTAFFFLLHYGFFHFIYLIFLFTMPFSRPDIDKTSPVNTGYIFLTVFLFFVNHLFSYLLNRPKDTKRQNIGTLMFYPYARIIPMHLTFIFGSLFLSAMPLFLILKTFADVLMHIIEHQVIRKGEE